MRASTLLLLSFAACAPYDEGLDRTVLSGTVVIPPAAVDDARTNDEVSGAQALGPDGSTSLTWRSVVVTGKASLWPEDGFGPGADTDGDPDSYAFTPVTSGTFTFTFTFATAVTAPPAAPSVDTGDTGTSTDTGDTGTSTDTGDTGTSTDTGDTGTSTDTGDTGTSTDTGDTGTSTDTGDTGTDTGDTGTTVDTGDTGTTVDTGDTGASDTGGADTGAAGTVDADVFELQLIDPSTYDADTGAGILASWSTDGSGGAFVAQYDVSGGADYVLRVLPKSTDAFEEPLDYTLVVSGSAPDDSTILVGAYAGADPGVAENPLGGTNAVDWAYDAATHTWTGAWKIMYLRSVTAVPDEDTEDLFEPSPVVVEGDGKVFLRAGTLTSLNAGPAAGALYSTASVEVAVTDEATTIDTPIVLDGVAPKVLGQQVAEELPDTTNAEIDLADYTIVEETLAAQEIGMLTGLGYVDVVTGASAMDPSTSGWNGANDSDAFSFTVPETMNVRMTASWDDAAADIDFGIWYADPDYGLIDIFSSWGDTYCLTGANPEVCETVVTLEPDTTYYLVALGYLGTDEEPYTVELEWLP